MQQHNKNALCGVRARPPVRAIGDQTVCRIVMKYGIAFLYREFSRNPEFREDCLCDNLTSNLHGGCWLNIAFLRVPAQFSGRMSPSSDIWQPDFYTEHIPRLQAITQKNMTDCTKHDYISRKSAKLIHWTKWQATLRSSENVFAQTHWPFGLLSSCWNWWFRASGKPDDVIRFNSRR
jgi:hypothetical protein